MHQPHTRHELLDELEELTDVLMRDQRELHEVLRVEKQQKVGGYSQAGGNTVADRNNAADLGALDLTMDAFKLRGEIAAHEARIRFIITALQYQES